MSVHIDAIGIVVTDMKQAIAFYERLGCSFPADAADTPHAESDLGGVRLMLDSAASLQEMGLTGRDDPGAMATSRSPPAATPPRKSTGCTRRWLPMGSAGGPQGRALGAAVRDAGGSRRHARRSVRRAARLGPHPLEGPPRPRGRDEDRAARGSVATSVLIRIGRAARARVGHSVAAIGSEETA